MREIKFRAWDKSRNVMLDRIADEFVFNDLGLKYIFDGAQKRFDFENFELMQSTGLKDKNSKEIYEGDLLRYTDKKLWQGSWEVVWSSRSWDIIPHPDTGGYDSDTIGDLLDSELGIFRVIGNIYENPELLNG